MNIGFEAKDFPEHGVTLIMPSDPAFESKVSSLLQGKENELKQLIETAKPFSAQSALNFFDSRRFLTSDEIL